MKADLDGKALIITGAASGVGRAIALQAAASGAEALLLSDRNAEGCKATADNVSADGTRAEMIIADIGVLDAPEQIAETAKHHFGRIDGLVNAAGLTTRGSFLDGTIKIWDELFAVNARAPFLLMQAVIKDLLVRRATGSIVNILSINAHCGAPELAVYSATKGALMTLTKNAANAHLPDRIRVNGINLGWTLTETEHRVQSIDMGLGENWAEIAARDLPLRRLLVPEEAARLAVFLLSEASAPMSGVAVDLEQRITGSIG
jgi:NAD(P)-dependent dehydrogenase (short-subunit alcohol dehydrogenase family)